MPCDLFVRCHALWGLRYFVRFPNDFFLAFGPRTRFPCEICCFLLHNMQWNMCRIFDSSRLWVRFAFLSCHHEISLLISSFLGRYELCVREFVLAWPLWDVLMRFHAFWLPHWRMRVIECTRWFIGRCVVVCVSWVIRLRGMNVSWVVVGEYGSALGEGFVQNLSDSCHQHDVTWHEHALVIQWGSLGVGREMYVIWRRFDSLGCHSIVIRVLSPTFLARWLWM